jgi:hypothetical protein
LQDSQADIAAANITIVVRSLFGATPTLAVRLSAVLNAPVLGDEFYREYRLIARFSVPRPVPKPLSGTTWLKRSSFGLSLGIQEG